MFPRSHKFLEDALSEGQASGIAFLLRRAGKADVAWYLGNHAKPGTGALQRDLGPASIFDLASVSKILSTVNLLFQAESEGKLSFADPVRKYFPLFPSNDATVLDLMNHRTGLPAHVEFFRRFENGEMKLGDGSHLLQWICEAGVPNRGKTVYSDLGFMLLGMILEQVNGKTLPEQFHERIVTRLKLESTGYVTLPHGAPAARMFGLLADKMRFVATEHCPWRKKTLQGEIHDDNTWALGGFAGHAGIFSTLEETGTLFDHLIKQVKASPAFLSRTPEAPGIFSYGFMTYPGLRASPGPAFEGAIGHTGYTGTSAWLHERTGTKAILLSNRVHPERSDGRWINTRLEFHKILWEELGFTSA
ncbi:MAG: class C beta-lactamase-related serine hydrolase [Proteobacteria bacterium]|nr:MAG: class C beta-lactamase-related serine hydrolase [Pseudomonadota bacterium]